MQKETICKDTVPGWVEENKTRDNVGSTLADADLYTPELPPAPFIYYFDKGSH